MRKTNDCGIKNSLNTSESRQKNKKKREESFSILVVEDEPILAKMLSISIKAEGYSVKIVSSISQAQKSIAADDHNLVLLSIVLKNCNALKFIPWLQENHPETDIITMTDNNPRELEEQVREFRVLYHLIKPFAQKELSQILKHLFLKKNTYIPSSKTRQLQP
ncbi:MAG: response regulator [Desulfobulbaceae bacterium]|nr:response regulator [Desulfobulbaceae bacterium]